MTILTKAQFLDRYIFHGLTDLNDGFDAVGISYFTQEEFHIVLQRIQYFGCGIYGIEPFLDGSFYAVQVHELNGDDPYDPEWFWRVFKEFCQEQEGLQYSASYCIPEFLLLNPPSVEDEQH